MRTVLLAVVAGVVAGVVYLAPTAVAEKAAADCSVSGAKYPELIPEYYVWEVYFRNLTLAASGEIEGLKPPQGKEFVPAIVRNNAAFIGISETDMLSFLEVGAKALKKLDRLRAVADARSEAEHKQSRLDAAEAILDARDDLARRLTPAAMRALRRSSPAKGSVFDFPTE